MSELTIRTLPTLDPEDAIRRALEALQAELRGILGDAVDAAARELEDVARYLTVHWRLIAAGRTTEAAENLEAVKATAQLIAARYALKTHRAARETMIRVVEELARVGAILLRGLIA